MSNLINKYSENGGLVISVIVKNDQDDFTAYLYDFIEQKNDNGASLLKYIVSYVSYVSMTHYELSYADQEEVQQEVAIKLLCQGREISNKFSKRFLYVMVRNQCIDQQRKKSRQLATFVPSNTSIDDISAPAPSLNEGKDISLLDSLNCLETIFSHIEAEPTGAKDMAIYTNYAFGLSHSEIAIHAGRTPNAIAKRLSILRSRLKRLQSEYC